MQGKGSTHPNFVKNLVKPDENGKRFVYFAKKPGGSLEGCISKSIGKRDGIIKKWIEKEPYDLTSAINEVIAGEFSVLVLGKNNSTKTALKLRDRLSYIKYDDCADLYNFFVKAGGTDFDTTIIDERLKKYPLTGLSEAITLNILLKNNDLTLGCFITPWSKDKPIIRHNHTRNNDVYGVDWEQSFSDICLNSYPDALLSLKTPQRVVDRIDDISICTNNPAYVRATLENQIDMDAVNGLIKRVALLSDNDIKSIGVRILTQLQENGVSISNKTANFIQDRTTQLLDVKESCRKHVGMDITDTVPVLEKVLQQRTKEKQGYCAYL